MKEETHKYAVSTVSESGDYYLYLLESKKILTENSKEMKKFLKKDCNDPGWEFILNFEEIKEFKELK